MADQSFDRAALEAVRRARAWCESEGAAADFRAFEAFARRSADARAYREVARLLGIPLPELRRRIDRVRERVREELRRLVADLPRGDP